MIYKIKYNDFIFNMFGNKRMNMASPCPDDLVKLQSEFVFQLQQGVVLLRHHLKFFDTAVCTNLLGGSADTYSHGYLTVFKRIRRYSCSRGIIEVNSFATISLSTTASNVVAFSRVTCIFCIRLAMATCSLGMRPAYSCQ